VQDFCTIDEGAGAGGGGGPGAEVEGPPTPPLALKYSSSRAISAGSSFSSIVVMSESPRSFSRSVTTKKSFQLYLTFIA